MKFVRVLLVEDNEGDIYLTKEALEERSATCKLKVIKDGGMAISFFEGLCNGGEVPHLVILDINLPKVNGHGVLQFIRHHETYGAIPVVMLTTSSSERDILSCYENQANCYIVKPFDAAEYIIVINKIIDFWSNVASLPKYI
jgi:CheY-like chemotaxis protein